MAIDASIYNAFKPETYGQRQERMMREQAAQQEREFNALRIQQAKSEMADKDRVRQESLAVQNALMGATTDDDRINRLTALGSPTAWGQADTLRKGILERQKGDADVRDKTAQAAEREFKMKREQLQDVLNAVSSSKDQNSYMQSLMMLKSRGYDLTGVPEVYDPAVVQRFGQQALTAAQRLEQEWKSKDFNLKANNEIIGADGKVNQTLLGAKQSVARAGASTVSINTGQKGLDNEFKLRGEFKGEPVYKAHQEMQAAHGQIRQALGQGTPASDLAAATKIMKLLDPTSVVRESELGMAMNATGLMDRLQNYAQNVVSGNKLTPKQRKEFGMLADSLYGESVKAYNSKRGEYEKLGGEYGLNAGRALGPNVESSAPAAAPKVIRFDAQGKRIP